ncbi:MAG TPA: hypothetical protein VIX19_16935 [Terriglobales bacterium]
MKPTLIMLIGAILLVAVFLAEIYVAALVFVLSCATVLLILAGTLIPAHSRTGHLALPAAEPGSFNPVWPCLENTKLDPYRDQHVRFRIEAKGFGLLGIVGIVAFVVITLVLSLHGNPFRPYREVGQSGEYVLFYVVTFASFVPAGIAGSWFLESIRLASSTAAFGSLDPHSGGYTFCDRYGARHGGTKKPMPPRPNDNICVVFYDPTNPGINTSSTGLMFHRLRLEATSAQGAE